ncbi:MAG: DUF2617 family protein [Anaerolineae bacterium]|nr:DUF2617 family protein [Anaerolineae bacterium]
MFEFKNLALQDVTFALCAQSVPLDEFKVVAHRDFEIDRQSRGSVSIIGQSHVLRFSRGAEALSEILLCVPYDLTAYSPINQTKSSANFRFSLELGHLKYATRVSTTVAAAPDEWLKISGPFQQNANALTFHFPPGPLPYPPLTSLVWRIGRAAVTVKSIHTFPAENALVKTHTRLNWA